MRISKLQLLLAGIAAVLGLVGWACYQVAMQPIEWDMEPLDK